MKTAYSTEYPSIYRGVVEDNIDPEGLGRCKIRVPSVHGELSYPVDILPWARPIIPSSVGKGRGSVDIPDKGDIVWVFFEGSNRNFPVYIGGTYAKGDINVSNDVLTVHTEQGDIISYHRTDRYYTISAGSTRILVTTDSITMVGDANIEGDLNISGNLRVSGDTILNNLTITGSCNKEGSHS